MSHLRSKSIFQPIEQGGEIPHSIVRQIKSLIRRGRLKVGDQLPGERVLIRQLKVSRSSLREALQALAATGFISIIPGKGTFVRSPSVRPELLMKSIMWPWADNEEKALSELFQVRSLLEVEAAGLAAERADPNNINLIQSELNRLASAIESRDIEEMAAADVAFHRAIFQATGNGLMVLLIDSIATPLQDSRVFAFRLSGGHPDTIQDHANILRAIEAADTKAARESMSAHLQRTRRMLGIYMASAAEDPLS